MWEERYQKVISEELPSFQCVNQQDWQELLRDYFFKGVCLSDILPASFQFRYGKRTFSVDFAKASSELTTVLFFLNLLLGQTTKEEKKYASNLVSFYSDGAIFLSAMEKDFNEMKFILAFLAKRAWNLDENLEDYMKNLDTILLELFY